MNYDRKKIVTKIVDIAHKAQEGHIPSSLSIIDLLYVIYSNHIIKHDSKFVLSKGHASLGLYAILDEFNLLNENIANFCAFESQLGGHPTGKMQYIECSTGSLGHGMPFAVGMSLGYKIRKKQNKIFVIIGDGEANEGTIWESALLAAHHKLNNLCCIIDYNRSSDRALDIKNIEQKFVAFNWFCHEIDGHNLHEIQNVLDISHQEKPHLIIANTIKGKGIPIMENNPEWHHKSPNVHDLKAIIESIR